MVVDKIKSVSGELRSIFIFFEAKNMERIASFTVDHIRLNRGIYVSRIDEVNGNYLTSFDIRMKLPNSDIVEKIKKQYPKGTRVELVRMEDIQAPPEGTKGTVAGVDDTGSIMVKWDNGSGLNVVYGEDICRKMDT